MRVDVPDYKTFVDFPDDTSPEMMQRVLAQNFPKKETTWDKVKGIVTKAGEAYMGAGEELGGVSRATSEGLTTAITGTAAQLPAALGATFALIPGPKGSWQEAEQRKAFMESGPKVPADAQYAPAPSVSPRVALARKVQQQIGEAGTFRPRTKEGEVTAAAIGEVANYPFKPIQKAGEWISQYSPELGYAVESLGPIVVTAAIGGIFKKVYTGIKDVKAAKAFYKDMVEEAKKTGKTEDQVTFERLPDEAREELIQQMKDQADEQYRRTTPEGQRESLAEEVKDTLVSQVKKDKDKPTPPVQEKKASTQMGGQMVEAGEEPQKVTKVPLSTEETEVPIKTSVGEETSPFPPEYEEAAAAEQRPKATRYPWEQSPNYPPGAMRVGQPQNLPEIGQLTQAIENTSTPKASLGERLRIGERLAGAWDTAKNAPKNAFQGMKAATASLSSSLTKYAPYTDFKRTLGQYSGALNRSAFYGRLWANEVKRAFPDIKSREAIVNWIQAGGDDATLAQWQQAGGKYTKGYERARNLTPEERTFAGNVMNYFDAQLTKAIQVGVLDHGVENFVTQIWKKTNDPHVKRIQAEIAAGKLRADPYFARKRIFQSYFEGEQAGKTPANKDIGYLITAYDRAMNEAIAARSFIRSMTEGTASDGRPLVHVKGYVERLPKDEGQAAEAYFIKPHGRPADFSDYKTIDHPALRKWKMVMKDEEGGAPVIMQGDMGVHPEAYHQLKNVLTKSAIRNNPVGRAVLTTTQTLKSTLLGLSGFHQVQEGLHAVFHKVNPVNVPKIDLTNPLQGKLIDHGLMVAGYDALEMFGEGLTGGGLISKIPGVGHVQQLYSHYLFQDYIPRLKMKMATEAYERNTKRFSGKLTDDQILEMTANQSNAAFGELNYTTMARNKTFQDSMRLLVLAPDFLEARGRFVGQALTPSQGMPWKNEQFLAAAWRGAVGQYAIARVLNAVMNDGDARWDIKDAFSLKIGENDYMLRTIPGDVMHLLTDPQSFTYNRLNPQTVRTIAEAIFKRDARGNFRTGGEQLKDFFDTVIPIPAKGLTNEQMSLWKSVGQSMGINVFKDRTAFEKELQTLRGRTVFYSSPEDRERQKRVNKYADTLKEELQKGPPSAELRNKVIADMQSGKLFQEDEQKIWDRATGDRVLNLIKGMSAEDIVSKWDKASIKEQQEYIPALITKIDNLAEKNPERMQRLMKSKNFASVRAMAGAYLASGQKPPAEEE